MPELPEVETVRRSLEPVVLGARVRGVTLRRRDVARREPPGRVRRRDLLDGALVSAIRRRGKQLALIADDGRTMVVHLGMSGQLLALGARRRLARTDHVHVEWRLERDGAGCGRMVFRDPRRFGGVWTFESEDELRSRRWSALGPDAATITDDMLAARLAGTTRALKPALLDQGVLAGLGNIYVDESLFESRLSPHRASDSLTPEQVAALGSAIRRVLGEAIEAGGSTLRDYVDSAGASGFFQLSHRVYGRGGQACRACGKTLAQASVAQRTTVWCPHCQQ